MLLDLIIFVALLAIALTRVGHLTIDLNPSLAQTKLGVLALTQKLQAVHRQQQQSLIISRHHQPFIHQYLNDCHLTFKPNGNASRAVTCKSDIMITLRPGEGGIGYPWD